MSLHFIAVVNLSLPSSFRPTTPPHKMFRDKHGIFPCVHWKLPRIGCIGSCQELVQVFVCGEDQAFFKSDCNLTKALLFSFVLIMFLMLNTPSVSQGFFSFFCITTTMKTMNLKEQSLPPLWQSLKKRSFE